MLRNKLRYLLLLVSIGVLSVLYNKYYMGIIFLTIVAMPFLLFGMLSYVYGKVTVELNSLVHIVNKGENIPVSIQLNNATIFPVSNMKLYLTYKNTYSLQSNKKEFKISLDARTKTTVYCNLYSEYAGNLEIKLNGIRIYDYLKIFSLRKKRNDVLQVAVLPRYYELSEGAFELRNKSVLESDYYSNLKSGDDPSEVFSIREYREGDRLQRIHWKISMKQDQLMIKEFSDPLNCSILLFIDLSIPLGEPALVFADSILECSLSLSFTFLTKGQIHYIAWYDMVHGACRRIRVTQEKDLFEAVDGLLKTSLYTRNTDALNAYHAEYHNDQYSDVIIVTGELTKQELDTCSMYKSFNKQIIYIREEEDFAHEEVLQADLSRKSEEIGIELHTLSIGNIKTEMEQLKLC